MKFLLLLAISFLAFASIISGILMISKPDGSLLNLPLHLIEGTAFTDYLIPGIILTTVVGGSSLTASVQLLRKAANRYNWSIAAGAIITGWIIAQMVLISTAHWLHFVFLGLGLYIILTAYQLKGKWVV